MKAILLLTAVALAAPSAAFADHYYGGHFRGGFGWGYGPYCPPCGYYAPVPVVGITFGARPYGYPDAGYYEPGAASLEARVQRVLRREGYYSGAIDGNIGPRSRAAIREYQSEHKMPVTGRIDGRLLRSLGF